MNDRTAIRLQTVAGLIDNISGRIEFSKKSGIFKTRIVDTFATVLHGHEINAIRASFPGTDIEITEEASGIGVSVRW